MGNGIDTFEKGKTALRTWRYVYACQFELQHIEHVYASCSWF